MSWNFLHLIISELHVLYFIILVVHVNHMYYIVIILVVHVKQALRFLSFDIFELEPFTHKYFIVFLLKEMSKKLLQYWLL